MCTEYTLVTNVCYAFGCRAVYVTCVNFRNPQHNVCGGEGVETFTSRCIQSVEAKLYFMEMDVESKPTLVAFLQCDSYAGVCAGTNTTPACLSKTIRPRLVP